MCEYCGEEWDLCDVCGGCPNCGDCFCDEYAADSDGNGDEYDGGIL